MPGVLAQSGERLDGIQEAAGAKPADSNMAFDSRVQVRPGACILIVVKFRSRPFQLAPEGRAKQAYRDMKQRCLNANGRCPAYASVELRMTRDEWLDWAVPRYRAILDEDPCASPSVARRSDSGHYEIGNIEIKTSQMNRDEQKTPRVAVGKRKTCSRCERGLSVLDFTQRRDNVDGLDYWCRDCKREVNAVWRASRS